MSSSSINVGLKIEDLLEEQFGYFQVAYLHEEDDSHALYFFGYDCGDDGVMKVDIKARIDSEEYEVWCREQGTEDWYYIDNLEVE